MKLLIKLISLYAIPIIISLVIGISIGIWIGSREKLSNSLSAMDKETENISANDIINDNINDNINDIINDNIEGQINDKDKDFNEDYILPVRIAKSQRALDKIKSQQEHSEKQKFIYEEKPSNEVINLAIEKAAPVDLSTINISEDKNISPMTPLWQRMAVNVDLSKNKPMIAIVIDDVGINQRRSKAAIALKGILTISFIPYGYNLQKLADKARLNGHEIMLHMPMQPINDKIDPGPNALLATLEEGELLKRIQWNLSQFNGYVGVNNHMGSRFTIWDKGMRLVIRELKERGLLFMDSITNKDTVGFKIAANMAVPYARRDIFIDHEIDDIKIAQQLKKVERLAKKQGYAVAIGHPHDKTVNALQKWLIDIEERGFTLVPVSAIVKHRLNQTKFNVSTVIQ